MNLPPPLSAHDQAIAEARAEHAFDDGVYGHYEIAKMRASPDNRKRFDEQKLQELAESIKSMGVAQAILIRPVTPTAESPEVFEIVAGERRFRASKIAGKTHIPALCRNLSDLDAAKIRILENLQREDPHPMEEAEGYQLLMLQHGFTADQLVSEVKKSRAYIYGRLKLCALTTEVRELFLDNQLVASTALLIARIPVPALQVKAAKEILHPPYGDPLSYRQAVNHVQNRYMLNLGEAVFSLTDAKLLGAAGACMKCPKRAGNQPEVFEGVDANVCTDPDCFAEKKAAHYNATITLANKKGIPVHEGPEAAALFHKAWERNSEFVHADVHLAYFERNAPTTKNAGYVNDHLSSETLPPVALYAKKNDGQVEAFYRRVDVQRALEAAGACETVEAHAERMRAIAADPSLATQKTKAQLQQEEYMAKQAATRAAAEKETVYRLSLYKQLRQRASVAGLSLQSLREFAKVMVQEHDLDSDVHDLYEFDVSTDLDGYIDNADAGALQLLLLDVMLGARLDATWADEEEFATVVAMARHEGIDVDAVRAEAFPPPAPAAVNEPAPQVEAPAAADQAQDEARAGSLTVRYRNPNDPSQAWTGRGRQPRWISQWIESGKSLKDLEVEPAPAAGDQVDAGQQQDKAPATDDQPHVGQAETSPTQVEETPAASDTDAEDLVEQLAIVEAVVPTIKQAKSKSTKAKPAAKEPATGKATKNTPAKTPKAAPGAAAAPSADPWPFPKSSDGKRDQVEPVATEVAA
jgi:ParB/RepB/Spo0J family partition protein